MQLISKFNKAILFYYVIDVLSKYAWVIPFKDRKNIIITHAFQKFLYESIRQWILQQTNEIMARKKSTEM